VKKQWWEKEVQAVLHGGDDPEEFPGLGRSVEEDYRQITMDPRQTTMHSARDHGSNFIELTEPFELPAPKEEEDDDNDWSFGTSNDDGDDLVFSIFGAGHR
jgi:hypothetical protein